MSHALSDEQVAFFREHGYLTPLRAMSEEEAAKRRADLEAYERRTGTWAGDLQLKAHAFFRWSWDLSRSPAIVDVARSLLGPDIFVFASRFWIKEPHDGKHVSWHQDMTYFDLDPQDMITFWIALTPATAENGAMRFFPGSHRKLWSHEMTDDKNNLLTRGQTVVGVDESKALLAPLRPGEFSVHHGNLLHNSPPNTTSDRRIGLALMLMPTYVRSTRGRRSLLMLCGEDRYGYWDHDPEPTCDEDPVIKAAMDRSFEEYMKARAAQSHAKLEA
jgi:non-heme Fe2+,alpha-ketoglutarate-dependent halogenase